MIDDSKGMSVVWEVVWEMDGEGDGKGGRQRRWKAIEEEKIVARRSHVFHERIYAIHSWTLAREMRTMARIPLPDRGAGSRKSLIFSRDHLGRRRHQDRKIPYVN